MDEPVISIIVPVYNVEAYIEACIRSVAELALPCPTECILVDDCGSDNSMAVATEAVSHAGGDVEFVIVRHRQNMGLAEARNTGILSARGEFVIFVDSDDRLLPNALQTLYRAAMAHPEADFIQADYQAEEPSLNSLSQSMTLMAQDAGELYLANLLSHGAWARLYRKQFFIRYGCLFRPDVCFEDSCWLVDALPHLYAIRYEAVPVYYYRTNAEGIMHSPAKRDFRLQGHRTMASLLLDNRQRLPWQGVTFLMVWNLAACILDADTQKDKVLWQRVFRQVRHTHNLRLTLAMLMLALPLHGWGRRACPRRLLFQLINSSRAIPDCVACG